MGVWKDGTAIDYRCHSVKRICKTEYYVYGPMVQGETFQAHYAAKCAIDKAIRNAKNDFELLKNEVAIIATWDAAHTVRLYLAPPDA